MHHLFYDDQHHLRDQLDQTLVGMYVSVYHQEPKYTLVFNWTIDNVSTLTTL